MKRIHTGGTHLTHTHLSLPHTHTRLSLPHTHLSLPLTHTRLSLPLSLSLTHTHTAHTHICYSLTHTPVTPSHTHLSIPHTHIYHFLTHIHPHMYIVYTHICLQVHMKVRTHAYTHIEGKEKRDRNPITGIGKVTGSPHEPNGHTARVALLETLEHHHLAVIAKHS